MRCISISLISLALIGPVKAEEDHSFWWYTQAKIACVGDVIRLCKSDMPNEDKVRNCMKDKKDAVSQGCAEFYPGGKNAD